MATEPSHEEDRLAALNTGNGLHARASYMIHFLASTIHRHCAEELKSIARRIRSTLREII